MSDEPARRSPGSGLETSALLRRLPGVRAFDLELTGAEMRTPAMRRLRLTAEGLETFDPLPGQDLMVAVPAGDGEHFRRRYTIRHFSRAVPELVLDMVLHGDGPGARWAAAARVGDRVEALGPRGKITLVEGARWHLFVGDESVLPTTFAMIEALAPEATAIAVLEVSGAEEHQEPERARCTPALYWQHRLGAPGTGSALADALDVVDFPEGPGHAYLAGELRQVGAARASLVRRGMDPGAIDHKAYWRLGVANAAHGEPERQD